MCMCLVSTLGFCAISLQTRPIGLQKQTHTCIINVYVFREHPFNLRGGLWFISLSNYFFSLRSQAEFFFATSCGDIIFFLQKQYFLSPKEQTEYIFLPMSETDFFPIKFADRKWMFPY